MERFHYDVLRAVRTLLRFKGDPKKDRQDWGLANYSDGKTKLLFLDGWLSIGDDKSHLASVNLKHTRDLGLSTPWEPNIGAFSYYFEQTPDQGKTYVGDDANGSVEDYVRNLTQVLQDSSTSKWVIAAHSMGSIVATITLLNMLESETGPVLRDTVPLLILLAPAFFGAPYLEAALSESPERLFEELPAAAIEIGRADYDLPTKAREAIGLLLNAGIAITIIYSCHDQFAPYYRMDDTRIFHYEVPTIELLRRGRISQIDSHMQVRSSESSHVLIHHLTKPIVSLQQRK